LNAITKNFILRGRQPKGFETYEVGSNSHLQHLLSPNRQVDDIIRLRNMCGKKVADRLDVLGLMLLKLPLAFGDEECNCGMDGIMSCNKCSQFFCDNCNTAMFCNKCSQCFCDECKTVMFCDECSQCFCDDCESVMFCNKCSQCFCDECKTVMFCDECSTCFCDDCESVMFCDACSSSFCDNCKICFWCEDCGVSVCEDCSCGACLKCGQMMI
jgi:hypothetical protein